MATKIRILPENLTNKIAAGEVVERPASVAKELVENALDAGSKEVVVEIESGGRRLIKVTDSGSGMSREDALLALERHATSKIASDEDLFALSTLGFRGEALPSVASVSRLTISTRTSDSLEGTEIYVEGGRIKEVKECGMAPGTVIAVRNLFFNTPARLKFMKSAETEGGHVGELLTRLAISRPDVRFTYKNEGKTVFRALDADLKERVATLLGRSIASFLYPVCHEEPGGVRVTGLVAAPECSRSAGSHLYTYINGRFIRDKVVQHAILQAYRNFLERGRYPVVAVFIDIAPGEVDVNVHPTKHEVRFREQGRVHDAIQYAVESVLKQTPWLKRAAVPIPPASTASGTGQNGAVGGAASTSGRPASVQAGTSKVAPPQVAGAPPVAAVKTAQDPVLTAEPPVPSVSEAKVAEIRELLVGYQPKPQPALRPHYHFEAPAPKTGEPASLSLGEEPAAQPRSAEPAQAPRQESETPGYFSSLAVIGQFNASYILCQRGTDLVLIDQHAAHERVAFEKLKAEFAGKEVDSQGLLFPETLELSFRESAVLRENLEELRRLGFAFEEFGGNTWLLNGVPQLLAGTDYLRTIRDILEELSSLSRSRTFTDIQEDLLARIACHSVVRGRRTLTAQEISALFRQMDETDFSSNCPHGRPVMQTLTLTDVEKMFKRV
ncbi:DNA mismatch repair endonuclease MutL [Geomonas paludis]|uniref:DNA mismatch repair protein MutL n=1 Tax=Geomonas paludis TaxID=2740185 RepID=A0A6V8N0Q0_9BACT|nr:DNA mismatch repair endonuclease MutL [Geomonas paludis]UPU35223.1 DNA mismatch repair endonuclease MutL [Geomonas paludis]GFO64949.1 DNA mismatch repair protein MutL [Geomonas paludis]